MMRSLFKLILIVLSLIPLYFAVTGMFGGAAASNSGVAVSAELDNQFRYLSAYYLSLFFLIWWVLGDIDRRGAVLAWLILAIFIGGLARLFSHLHVGPSQPMQIIGMILELGSPILILWQRKIAHSVGPVVP